MIITGIWIISSLLAAPMAIALRVGMVEEAPGHLKPFCYNIHLEVRPRDTITSFHNFLNINVDDFGELGQIP